MELTPLGQRLACVASSPDVEWRMLAENIPVWPSPPQVLSRRDDGDARYAPSQGIPALRAALCQRDRALGADVSAESVLVTNGGFDALGLVARHLREAGVRRAVCTGPVLSSMASLFDLTGLSLVVEDWPVLLTERGWRAMRLAPGDMLYVNTPHNPTGACLAEPVAQELLADQQRRGFTVVFDLVYDSFVYGGLPNRTPLSLVEDWTGVYGINSMSKNYGAPGLRVGWMVAEPSVIAQLTARLEVERIAVSTGAQLRAAQLCQHGNTVLSDRVREGHQLVQEWLRDQDIPESAAGGGTQAWLDLQVGDAERFADLLMTDYRTVLATGANYFPQSRAHIRLPVGIPGALLSEGLDVLAKARHQMGSLIPLRCLFRRTRPGPTAGTTRADRCRPRHDQDRKSTSDMRVPDSTRLTACRTSGLTTSTSPASSR